MSDLISRQAAIDALNEYFATIGKLKRRGLTKGEKAISLDTVGTIETLPSVQPEKRTEKRTETHACDCISRQAAIEALHMHLMYRMGTDSNKKRLDEWINNLPSVQPEIIRCKDCKHYVAHSLFGRSQGWCERLCDEFDKSLARGTEPDDYCSRAEPYKGD